jgi:hypothetical protein
MNASISLSTSAMLIVRRTPSGVEEQNSFRGESQYEEYSRTYLKII